MYIYIKHIILFEFFILLPQKVSLNKAREHHLCMMLYAYKIDINCWTPQKSGSSWQQHIPHDSIIASPSARINGMARVESRAEPYQAGMNVALQTAKYRWIYQKVIQFYCTTYIYIYMFMCIYIHICICDVVYKLHIYIMMYTYIYIGSISNPMRSSKMSTTVLKKSTDPM